MLVIFCMLLYVVAEALADVGCILYCDSTSKLPSTSSENAYLELPIVVSEIFLNLLCFSLI